MNDGLFHDFIPSNCSITPQQMRNRRQDGAKTFQYITEQSINEKELLMNSSNWCIIIDSMYQNANIKAKDRIKLLDQFLNIAKNSLKEDQHRIIKYKTLNAMCAKCPGFREFVNGLGFIDGIYENRLMLIDPNQAIINTAINAIQNTLHIIKKYEDLCTLWQTVIELMLMHPSYKKNQSSLNKLTTMNFLLNYNEYYDILSKLIPISTMKIYSRDGLILQIIDNIGINIAQMGNDTESNEIFECMAQIYDKFKKIEEFKRDIRLTNYYKMRNEYYESKENKYDENDIKSDALKEIEKRRNTGIEHFKEILNIQSDDDKFSSLLNPLNWDILIDGICLNMSNKDDKKKKLEKLKNMAQKACHDINYRVIKLDTKGAIKYIVNTYGAILFLKGIGFYEDIVDNKLIFLNESQPIIDAAINSMMYKIKIVQHKDELQKSWNAMTHILLKHPSFEAQIELVAALHSMDLYNNYENYYDIVDKVRKTSFHDLKQIPMKFGEELGLQIGLAHVLDKDSTKTLLYNLAGIYSKIKEIEVEKEKHKHHVNTVIEQDIQMIGVTRMPSTENILDLILEYSRKWNDDKYDKQQLFTDEELAKLYELDDIHDLENEMLTKVYDLHHAQSAVSFQMDEFLEYIQNFRRQKQKKIKSRPCADTECGWSMDKVELWSVQQRQIVHVMFYHTEEYMDIATSEIRANRFQHQESENAKTKLDTVVPHSKPASKYSTPEFKTQGFESKSDEFDDEKTTPRGPAPEPGAVCSKGNNCEQLSVLLHKCYDVNIFNDSWNNNADGSLNDEIDHCLDFHGDFRRHCIYEKQCKFKEKLKECHNHRFIQLHGHFYHDNAIDADEVEGKLQDITDKTVNEEKMEQKQQIQYKLGIDSIDKNAKPRGILEFGSPFVILKKSEARFKNPKAEILGNKYHTLKKVEWNELLKKCVRFAQSISTRKAGLNMKELVSLKLYTDFDKLQREFRKCFRGKDESDRAERQRQFFYWNNILETVCKKSKDVIPNKLYHGISDKRLAASCFSGTYYGPVSTTTDLKVAKGFAGNSGQILELYPSFGASGLIVSWLSNFPDENEVLYMNVAFQISNIVMMTDDPINKHDFEFDTDLNQGVMTNSNMEYCILKALQTININSQIISLNDVNKEDNADQNESDLSNFKRLKNYEKLSVLYLLYLQYKPKEWNAFVSKSKEEYLSNAFMKFRDQFVSLAQNVKAVSMDNMCKLLQIFFYTKSKDYTLPILSSDLDFSVIYNNLENQYKANQSFYFSIIVKLFPSAQQIALNTDNFDWSLKRFVDFLNVYDFEFHKIALQDIYIGSINERDAKQRLVMNKARENIYKLKKLGWTFVSPMHLHRVEFEPLPALPFVMTFSDYDKDNKQNAARIFRSHSQFVMLNVTPGGSDTDDEAEEKEGKNDEDDKHYVLVDHDPKSCVLSKQIFNTLEYKRELVDLLNLKRKGAMNMNYNLNVVPGIDNTKDRTQSIFMNECNNVESLVLNPVPNELYNVFYDNYDAKKKGKAVISFESVIKVFPSLTDLFLRNTTFKLRECFKFINFIDAFKGSDTLKLERVFFSKTDRIREKDVNKVKWRLKEIGWNFISTQQMIYKVIP